MTKKQQQESFNQDSDKLVKSLEPEIEVYDNGMRIDCMEMIKLSFRL